MKRIKLTEHYNSLSGIALEPGEYDVNDKRLKGRAAYLVNRGFAVALEGTIPATMAASELPVMPDEVVSKEDLQRELDLRDIEYDARWGVARLQELLDGTTE